MLKSQIVNFKNKKGITMAKHSKETQNKNAALVAELQLLASKYDVDATINTKVTHKDKTTFEGTATIT